MDSLCSNLFPGHKKAPDRGSLEIPDSETFGLDRRRHVSSWLDPGVSLEDDQHIEVNDARLMVVQPRRSTRRRIPLFMEECPCHSITGRRLSGLRLLCDLGGVVSPAPYDPSSAVPAQGGCNSFIPCVHRRYVSELTAGPLKYSYSLNRRHLLLRTGLQPASDSRALLQQDSQPNRSPRIRCFRRVVGWLCFGQCRY